MLGEVDYHIASLILSTGDGLLMQVWKASPHLIIIGPKYFYRLHAGRQVTTEGTDNILCWLVQGAKGPSEGVCTDVPIFYSIMNIGYRMK